MNPFLFFSFLLFLGGAWARLGVEVRNARDLVAGSTVEVRWSRILLLDPNDFQVRLRKTNGPAGAAANVNAFGRGSGSVTLTVPDSGSYRAEIVTSSRGNENVRATSQQFDAKAPTPPPQDPPKEDPKPPAPDPPAQPQPPNTPTPPANPPATNPPNNPSSPTPSPSPPAPGGNTNTGTNGTPPTSSPGQGSSTVADPSNTTGTVGDAQTRNPVVIAGSTFIPDTTEQIVTLTSNSQTIVTTISPISFPTDATTGSVAPSGAAKKSNTPAIIGAVIGSLFVVLLLFIIFIVYRRRQRRAATGTFFRDKMVRNASATSVVDINRGGPILPIQSYSTWSPSPPAHLTSTPYNDLNEKFGDYDQSAVGSSSPHTHDPYSGMYESTYQSQLQSQQHNFSATPGQILHPPPTLAPLHIPREKTSSPPLESSPLGLPMPRTDRQMELHELIIELQAKMIGSQSWALRFSNASSIDGQEYTRLKGRVEMLESLMKSPWALGRTDEEPIEYLAATGRL